MSGIDDTAPGTSAEGAIPSSGVGCVAGAASWRHPRRPLICAAQPPRYAGGVKLAGPEFPGPPRRSSPRTIRASFREFRFDGPRIRHRHRFRWNPFRVRARRLASDPGFGHCRTLGWRVERLRRSAAASPHIVVARNPGAAVEYHAYDKLTAEQHARCHCHPARNNG